MTLLEEILRCWNVPADKVQTLERATFDQHMLEETAAALREWRCPDCGEHYFAHRLAPWCTVKYPDGPP